MSIIRVNIDIEIVEGGTFNKIYQWTQGDPLVPIDLSGYSARMQIRPKLKSTEILIDIESTEEIWTPDGNSGIYFPENEDEYDAENIGKWRIYIKDDDTVGICASHKDLEGAYDLFLYSPAGEAVLKQYGVASLIAAVTRNE